MLGIESLAIFLFFGILEGNHPLQEIIKVRLKTMSAHKWGLYDYSWLFNDCKWLCFPCQ